MGIDATTFILEIANFLVLLWLLRRFLFKPVQAVITRRQQETEAAQSALNDAQRKLDADRAALEHDKANQGAERLAARQQLQDDIAAERETRLAALAKEMADERAKGEARLAVQQAQAAGRLDAEADARAATFLRSYLSRLAGPALEAAIIEIFLADLAALPAAMRAGLTAEYPGGAIEVMTAFDISEAQRLRVDTALAELIGQPDRTAWRLEPALIAGLSIRLDGHVLETSLTKGLATFAASGEAST